MKYHTTYYPFLITQNHKEPTPFLISLYLKKGDVDKKTVVWRIADPGGMASLGDELVEAWEIKNYSFPYLMAKYLIKWLYFIHTLFLSTLSRINHKYKKR